MKNIFPFIFLLVAFHCFAQKNFEGKIVMRTENPVISEVSEITWYLKNGKHLLNYSTVTAGVKASYSLLSKEGKLELLSENGRKEIDMASLKTPEYDFSSYKLLSKEGGKILNEFECIRYTIESGNYVAECWMTDDPDLNASYFPDFMKLGVLPICEKLHQGGIPVQIKISERNGKTVYLQTISYIMPCKVDDAKFN